MLKIRWTLVLTFAALASFTLPAELQLAMLTALALGAAALTAVTRWSRSSEARAARESGHEIPLRTLWATKDQLPSPSGTHLRPSAGF